MTKFTTPDDLTLSAAAIAKLRREGSTWEEVHAASGLAKRRSSTWWGQLLASAGYDRLGRKGGKGKSEARAYGSDLLAASK